jgi:prepilin-type N-terminal cleavage/methylation domain-containing protein
MNNHRAQSGFSLIEITLVLALVGVISAFGVAMSYSSLTRTTVTQERDLFVTLLLRGTRSSAMANFNETSHGILIDNTNHEYILFNGTDPADDPSSHRVIPYTNDAIAVTTTSADDFIVFEQLSGEVITGAGVITITNGTAAQDITIRTTGQIDW